MTTTFASQANESILNDRQIDDKFNSTELERRRRQIGAVRKPRPQYSENDVYDFLGYMDDLWPRLYELVEETVNEFENWNKWFKKEKKKPPVSDRSKVFYIRDEYQKNRSPHLWKSNPNRRWVLAFGNNIINNIVASILYKYQNETISKDA